MEEERKRKRREAQSKVGKEEEEAVEEQAAPPSEEEVEEFFSILKNMQAAMKYFEKNGGNIGNLLKGEGKDKITAMECDADNIKVDPRGGLQLDLNAVPEDSV